MDGENVNPNLIAHEWETRMSLNLEHRQKTELQNTKLNDLHKRKLQLKDEEIDQLYAELASYKSKVEEREREFSQREKEFSQRTQGYSNLLVSKEQELDRKKDELNRKKDELNRKDEDLTKAKSDLQNKDILLHKREEEYGIQLNKYEQEIKKREDEFQKRDIDSEKRKEYEKKSVEYEKRMQRMSEKMNSLDVLLEKEKTRSSTLKTLLEKEKANSERERVNFDKERSNFQREKTNYENFQRDYDREKNDFEIEKSHLEKERQRLEKKVTMLERNLKEIHDIQDLVVGGQHQSRNTELRDQLIQKDRELHQKEQSLNLKTRENESKSKEIEQLRSEVEKERREKIRYYHLYKKNSGSSVAPTNAAMNVSSTHVSSTRSAIKKEESLNHTNTPAIITRREPSSRGLRDSSSKPGLRRDPSNTSARSAGPREHTPGARSTREHTPGHHAVRDHTPGYSARDHSSNSAARDGLIESGNESLHVKSVILDTKATILKPAVHRQFSGRTLQQPMLTQKNRNYFAGASTGSYNAVVHNPSSGNYSVNNLSPEHSIANPDSRVSPIANYDNRASPIVNYDNRASPVSSSNGTVGTNGTMGTDKTLLLSRSNNKRAISQDDPQPVRRISGKGLTHHRSSSTGRPSSTRRSSMNRTRSTEGKKSTGPKNSSQKDRISQKDQLGYQPATQQPGFGTHTSSRLVVQGFGPPQRRPLANGQRGLSAHDKSDLKSGHNSGTKGRRSQSARRSNEGSAAKVTTVKKLSADYPVGNSHISYENDVDNGQPSNPQAQREDSQQRDQHGGRDPQPQQNSSRDYQKTSSRSPAPPQYLASLPRFGTSSVSPVQTIGGSGSLLTGGSTNRGGPLLGSSSTYMAQSSTTQGCPQPYVTQLNTNLNSHLNASLLNTSSFSIGGPRRPAHYAAFDAKPASTTRIVESPMLNGSAGSGYVTRTTRLLAPPTQVTQHESDAQSHCADHTQSRHATRHPACHNLAQSLLSGAKRRPVSPSKGRIGTEHAKQGYAKQGFGSASSQIAGSEISTQAKNLSCSTGNNSGSCDSRSETPAETLIGTVSHVVGNYGASNIGANSQVGTVATISRPNSRTGSNDNPRSYNTMMPTNTVPTYTGTVGIPFTTRIHTQKIGVCGFLTNFQRDHSQGSRDHSTPGARDTSTGARDTSTGHKDDHSNGALRDYSNQSLKVYSNQAREPSNGSNDGSRVLRSRGVTYLHSGNRGQHTDRSQQDSRDNRGLENGTSPSRYGLYNYDP